MIESVEGEEGFPPCLVLERGDYTLADRLGGRSLSSMEQRAILFPILKGLDQLHEKGYVHGKLDAVHVVFFSSDFSWKLVSLESETFGGEPADIQQICSRYAAPEVYQALSRKWTRIRLHPAADMWSFGLIAFEVFARCCVTKAREAQRYVANRLAGRTARGGRGGVGPGEGGIGIRTLNGSSSLPTSHSRQEEEELSFVLALLRQNPAERITASQALKDVVFRTATDARPVEDTQEVRSKLHSFPKFLQVAQRGHEEVGTREQMDEWQKMLFLHMISEQLHLEVEVGRPLEEGHPQVIQNVSHESQIRVVKSFYDDYLPKNPVHVLKAGEVFRLQICITPNDLASIPLLRIETVTIQPPDGEPTPVELRRWSEGSTLGAVVTLEPSQFPSEELNSVSPIFGLVETKYVKLLLEVNVQLEDGFPQGLALYKEIYLQLKHPQGLLDRAFGRVERITRRLVAATGGIAQGLAGRLSMCFMAISPRVQSRRPLIGGQEL